MPAGRRGEHEPPGPLPRFDLDPALAMTCKPIGVVRSPFVWRDEAPRQPGVGEARPGTVVLKPGMQNALKDLEGFSHCWLLCWFHRSHGWKPQIVPPRDTVKHGLFATRSPDRPNPIGLSVVAINCIYGCRLHIIGHDLLDGTPVLDIKPYIPAYDSIPGADAGWTAKLAADAPDHRLPENGWMPASRRGAAP